MGGRDAKHWVYVDTISPISKNGFVTQDIGVDIKIRQLPIWECIMRARYKLLIIALFTIFITQVYGQTTVDESPLGWQPAQRGFWSSQPSMRQVERADSLKGFDIQKYTIHLKVDDATRHIEGKVIADVVAEESLTSIQYRLEGGSLAVDEVRVDGAPAAFTHQDGIIEISVDMAAGQSFSTSISYSGIPGNSPSPYNIGLLFTPASVYTLSNPDAGRWWWPSYDHPWDKALVEWYITVREDWLAAANGLRMGITDNQDGTRTHHWVSSSPIATYVIGFAAAAYVEFMQEAGDIPIQNFVLPGQLANASVDFANTPAMIDFFSDTFGAYPFEKYGHAVVNMSTYAAMEHQTMTTFGSQYLTGDQRYEHIVAHELAHQWYGNYLTPITMREVWLKESFATYSEFLWEHHKSGWEQGLRYLRNSIQQYYINWENSNGPHTIFNPSYNLMFAPPTYEKSASVLHMLRLKMGNDAFFAFIRALLTTYPNGNINTAEFIDLAQQHSGQDLGQFFRQWIYSDGIPDVQCSVFHNADQRAKIYAKSISPTATEFYLDLPLKLNVAAPADSVVIMAGPEWTSNYIEIGLVSELEGLRLDPNHWLLTRNLSLNEMQLTACLAYSDAVSLNWNAYPSDIPLLGYHVFRKTLPDGQPIRVNPIIITDLEYTDTSVINGETYEYQVCAVDVEGYLSMPSNAMVGRPIDFPFDLGFLVVDETRDGNGSAFSPTDVQVDDFYDDALQGFEYIQWDIDTDGYPQLEMMARHPLILWHSDDFSEIHLDELQDDVGSYVLSGGKLILSGWKHPSVFSEGFISRFLPDITLNQHNTAVFKAAHSSQYPSLYPDPTKLAAPWNGMLPMAYTFSGAQNPLYTAQIHESGFGEGLPAAIHIHAKGEMVLLGFPLYFMEAEGMKGFLQSIITQLQTVQEPDGSPAAKLYPNPLRENQILRLQLDNATLNSLEIFNIRGQKVIILQDIPLSGSGSAQHYQMPMQQLNDLASGCYLLKLNTSAGKMKRKFVIIR